MKGKDWFTTFLPEQDYDHIRAVFREAMSDIQTRGNINLIIGKDGREIFTEWYDTTLKDAGGNIIGILSIGQDITERKQVEEVLRESDEKLARSKKMESMGLLAGGVAHDLNNVLSGIVSYPDLLLMNLPEDSKLRKPIETMQESGNRAAAIVQDLLTVARGVAITK